jgi:hypothetical protein
VTTFTTFILAFSAFQVFRYQQPVIEMLVLALQRVLNNALAQMDIKACLVKIVRQDSHGLPTAFIWVFVCLVHVLAIHQFVMPKLVYVWYVYGTIRYDDVKTNQLLIFQHGF